jgi:hypothetical protein
LIPRLARYAKTHESVWKSDLFEAFYHIFGPGGGAMASVLVGMLENMPSMPVVPPSGVIQNPSNWKIVVKRYVPAAVWRPLKYWYHRIKYRMSYDR